MTPKIRQSFYYLSTIVTSVIGLALLYGGLKAGTANNITEILAGLGGLLGATGPALAAKKVGEQHKDGVFDDVSPAEKIVQGAQQLQAVIADAHDQASKAKDALAGALHSVPVLGDDLEAALDRIKF